MIDLHSHILPGLDDGVGTLEESVAMAQAALRDGIEIVAATPHVRDDFPTTPEAMEQALRELRDALAERDVPLTVLAGAEIALDFLPRLATDDVRRFGLGGNPACLLLEFPYYGWPLGLEDTVFRLLADGVTPVIAHPERNAEVQESPDRLASVVDTGALVQLTAASLEGRFGRRTRATAAKLLELRLAHVVASDAHAPTLRAIGLSAAGQALGSRTVARWLTREVPAAIVAGDPLPPRPAGRRWFSRPSSRS